MASRNKNDRARPPSSFGESVLVDSGGQTLPSINASRKGGASNLTRPASKAGPVNGGRDGRKEKIGRPLGMLPGFDQRGSAGSSHSNSSSLPNPLYASSSYSMSSLSSNSQPQSPSPTPSNYSTSSTPQSSVGRHQPFMFSGLMDRSNQTDSFRPVTSEKRAVSRLNARSSAPKIERLSLFRDVLVSDRHLLFQKKLKQCFVVFDFLDPKSDKLGKDVKSQIFEDLLGFMEENTSAYPEQTYNLIAQMASLNLFRPLSSATDYYQETYEIQDEVPIFDLAWPHINLVYTLVLKFLDLSQFDPELAKKAFDGSFSSQLVDLFESRDPRERDYVKKVLYKLYAKLSLTRGPIRKAIANSILKFAYETEKNPGMNEMLDILGSIINGLSLPLKDEHVTFFGRVLLSLLKPKEYILYSQKLNMCIRSYILKDSSLATETIMSLIRYWPVSNSMKEVKFLEMIEENLGKIDSDTFCSVAEPLFKRIAKCIESGNYIVAEKSLFLWNDEKIIGFISDHRMIILPIVFKSLMANVKDHWDNYIKSYSSHVLAFFLAIDEYLFRECHTKYLQDMERDSYKEEKRVGKWKKVESICLHNAPDQERCQMVLSKQPPLILRHEAALVRYRAQYDDITQLIKKIMGTILQPVREKRNRSPLPQNPHILQKLKMHQELNPDTDE